MKKIEAGVDYRFTVQVTIDHRGIVGQTVKLNLQRSSDNKWWNGSSWAVGETDLACTETESTIYPGEYYYELTGTEIQDGVIYKEQFKILSGLYTFNSIEELYAEYNVDKLTLEYDFTTYSKAVILWYDVDRPIGAATAIYWAYIYNSTGGKPVNSFQVCKKDRVIRWSEAQPV